MHACNRHCGDVLTQQIGVQLGLTELCHPTQGNFLSMPFKKEAFDAAYAIEATCHADKVGAADTL